MLVNIDSGSNVTIAQLDEAETRKAQKAKPLLQVPTQWKRDTVVVGDREYIRKVPISRIFVFTCETTLLMTNSTPLGNKKLTVCWRKAFSSLQVQICR